MRLLNRVLSYFDVAGECTRLRDRTERLSHELDEALIAKARLITVVEDMQFEIGQWRAKVRMLEQQRAELTEALEEANTRIAVLQDDLRSRMSDEQLELMHAPAIPEEETSGAGYEVIQDTTIEVCYRLVGIFFEGRHWWELALGDLRIKAPIHDKAFLDQIAARKVFFASGDAIGMHLRTVTYRTPDGSLYAKYFIERVLGIVPPDKQLSFEPSPSERRAQGARP